MRHLRAKLASLAVLTALLLAGSLSPAAAGQVQPKGGGTPPRAVALYPGDGTLSKLTNPTLSAVRSDIEGVTSGSTTFEVWSEDQATRLAAGTGPVVTEGARSAWTVPAGVLIDGTAYWWRAQTQGQVGWTSFMSLTIDTVDGSVVPSTPPKPGAPGNLVATAADGGAYLTWTPADAGVGASLQQYALTVYDSAGNIAFVMNYHGDETSAVITSLVNGGAYRYQLRADSAFGGSPNATTGLVTATAVPGGPSAFTNIATEYLRAESRLLIGTAATPADAVAGSTMPNSIRDQVLADGNDAVSQRNDAAAHDLSYTSYSVSLSDFAALPAAGGTTVTLRTDVNDDLGQTGGASTGSPYSSVRNSTRSYVFTFTSGAPWRLTGVQTETDSSEEASGSAPSGPAPGGAVIAKPVVMDRHGNLVKGQPLRQAKMLAASINYYAISDYAHRWAHSRNPSYHSRSDDCTNFASQAVRAGGAPMRKGWYRSTSVWWYSGLWPIYNSWTWSGAHNFFLYLNHHAAWRSYWNQAVPGDILFWDFNRNGHIEHTSVIVNYRGGQLWYAQHSTDYDNRSVYEGLKAHPGSILYIAHPTG